MSKIICDVCGTTYPETAAQCPICGCAKNSAAQTAAGDQTDGEMSYTYVKGGRFSKTNVRKRGRGIQTPEQTRKGTGSDKPNNTNKVLAAIVVVLLLAVAVVLGYMGLRVFFPDWGKEQTEPSDEQTTLTVQTQATSEATQQTETEATQQTSEPEQTEDTQGTEETQPGETTGISVTLSEASITLMQAGDGHLLTATVLPAGTVETVVYTSSDENVATVSQTGMVTAVSGGYAVITASCGGQTAQCQVLCDFGTYELPTETESTEVELPEGFQLTLALTDITISAKYPAPVSLYKRTEGVKATDITWTVDHPEIATVDENGVVSAVSKGNTTVRASIGDQTAICHVRIAFTPEAATEAKYKLSHTDVTLYVGDPTYNYFRITLTDSDGLNIDAEWTASHEGYVTIEGRNVTAVKSTADLPLRAVTITAEVDGQTYTCTVRVAEVQDKDE